MIPRTLLFISHANPEDNEFTRWLALRLASEGYEVWSDVTKLIGGEKWWDQIEDAIRNKTAKFLFILSEASNSKDGTKNELQLADTIAKKELLQDFIIPLRITQIPHSDMNVLIHRINAIDFTKSWAEGLANLLKKLSEDSVYKDVTRFNPKAVSDWWSAYAEGGQFLKNEPDVLLSNWFPISELPQFVYFHTIRRANSRNIRPLYHIRDPYPAFGFRDGFVSFASAEDLGITASNSFEYPTNTFLSGEILESHIDVSQAERALTFLLKESWNNAINGTGLRQHRLANNRLCHYFTAELLGGSRVSFSLNNGEFKGSRDLTGQATGSIWHWGLSSGVINRPFLAYVLNYHVLFSDDGKAIWDSNNKLHSKRRSACKQWWNPRWRDMLLASMYWIAKRQNAESIEIPLSSSAKISVPLVPMLFESAVTYDATMAKEGVLDEEPDQDGEVEA